MVPILIYDSGLNYIAQIDDYEYFRWTRKYRLPNDFEIRINRYKNGAEFLQLGNYLVFKKGSIYRVGRIEFKEISLDQDGKASESWKIMGYSMSGILNDRICMHEVSTGDGYDTITGASETVMKHYVDVNVVNPVDTDREVPNYVIATDQLRGPTIFGSARFQAVSEILYDLSLTSGLGYITSFDVDSKSFVFDVVEGKDRTFGNGVNPVVIFSPEFDNIKSLTFRDSLMGLKNFAIVGGQGEASARTVQEVGSAIGIDRKEVFVDARDLSSGLDQRGQERLSEYNEEIIMEFEHTQVGPFTYLTDFDLGDIVTVIYPGIVQMNSRIIEIVEYVEVDGGEKFSITVGSTFPDLALILKRNQRNIAPEIRR